MRVSYNSVEFKQVRLRNLQMFAEKDPTGYDVIMTRVEMEIGFQWSPFATSSTTQNRLLNGDGPFPNDSLGLSIRSLRKLLTEPRKKLVVAFGGDQVWTCPVPVGATLTTHPGGSPSSCDPGYGPQPEVVALTEVIGDKLAAGTWRVKFWVAETSNILLSNRWKVTATVNDAGMTTRLITGVATCRADEVAAGNINGVDDFRKFFLCPCPSGFRRTGCRVVVNEIGTVGSYQATDVEDPNPLGADGAGVGAVKFEGETTAGVFSVNKTIGAQIRSFLEIAAFGPLALIGQWPTTASNGWVKVTGGKGANKIALMKLAVAIAQDRFFNGSIVAFTVTQGVGQKEVDGRWVKISCVFLPTIYEWIVSLGIPLGWSTLPDNIPRLTNLNNDINLGSTFLSGGPPQVLPGGVAPDETDLRYKNLNLPNSGGTTANGQQLLSGHDTGCRGGWLGALITQSLQYQGDVPSQPPPNKPAVDSKLV